MAVPVLILGDSGSGKSTSLRNFQEGQAGVLNVACKPLPFRSKIPVIDIHETNELNGRKLAAYDYITYLLPLLKSNTIIIDDSQYLMSFEMFKRAKETGYNKFTEIGTHFYNLIKSVINIPKKEKIVYFLHHIDVTETNKIKAKTIGKMLDNQLCLEGLFSVVLLCKTDGKQHYFETQSDGLSCAKSPIGMFETMRIDNDLAFVDRKIREYWGL